MNERILDLIDTYANESLSDWEVREVEYELRQSGDLEFGKSLKEVNERLRLAVEAPDPSDEALIEAVVQRIAASPRSETERIGSPATTTWGGEKSAGKRSSRRAGPIMPRTARAAAGIALVVALILAAVTLLRSPGVHEPDQQPSAVVPSASNPAELLAAAPEIINRSRKLRRSIADPRLHEPDRHSDELTRQMLVITDSLLSQVKAVDRIRTVLEREESLTIRAEAATQLMSLNDPESLALCVATMVEYMASFDSSGNPGSLARLIVAYLNYRYRMTVPSLDELLRPHLHRIAGNEDRYGLPAARLAAKLLANIGRPDDALRLIEQLATSRDVSLRSHVIAFVTDLADETVAREALPVFRVLLESHEGQAESLVTEMLRAIETMASKPDLRPLVEAEIRSTLLRLATFDPPPPSAIRAFTSLVRTVDDLAILQQLARSDDPATATAALSGLARAAGNLEAALLDAVRDDVHGLLVEQARNNDPVIAGAAVRALGIAGQKGVIVVVGDAPLLRDLATRASSADVRRLAANLLAATLDLDQVEETLSQIARQDRSPAIRLAAIMTLLEKGSSIVRVRRLLDTLIEDQGYDILPSGNRLELLLQRGLLIDAPERLLTEAPYPARRDAFHHAIRNSIPLSDEVLETLSDADPIDPDLPEVNRSVEAWTNEWLRLSARTMRYDPTAHDFEQRRRDLQASLDSAPDFFEKAFDERMKPAGLSLESVRDTVRQGVALPREATDGILGMLEVHSLRTEMRSDDSPAPGSLRQYVAMRKAFSRWLALHDSLVGEMTDSAIESSPDDIERVARLARSLETVEVSHTLVRMMRTSDAARELACEALRGLSFAREFQPDGDDQCSPEAWEAAIRRAAEAGHFPFDQMITDLRSRMD